MGQSLNEKACPIKTAMPLIGGIAVLMRIMYGHDSLSNHKLFYLF